MDSADPSSSIKVFLVRTACVVFCLIFMSSGYVALPAKKIFYGLLAYLSASLIPVLYSPDRSISFTGIYPFFSSSGLACLCTAVIFIYACGIDKEKISRVFNAIILSSFFVSLYGLLQYAGLDPLNWNRNFYPRIWATLGNPNFLAQYLAVLLPLILIMYLKQGRSYLLLIFFTDIVALILTSSRAGFFSAVTGICFVIFFTEKDRRIFKRIRLVSVLFIMVLLIFTAVNGSRLKDISGRYLSSFSLKDSNIASRISQYGTAAQMFMERPVLGWGVNAYYVHFRRYMKKAFLEHTGLLSVPGYPHNYLLKKLVDGGILFTGIILWWWIIVFSRIWTGISGDDYVSCGITGCMVSSMVASMFSFNVAVINVLIWALAGLALNTAGDTIKVKLPPMPVKLLFSLVLMLLQLFSCRRLYADHLFARGEYEKARRFAPEVSKYSMRYGKKLYMEGRLDEAAGVFGRIVDSKPYNALAHNAMGYIMLDKKDYKKSREYLEKAIWNDPFLVEAHVKIAELFREMGDFAPAKKYYISALKMNPALTDQRYDLGVIYFKENDLTKAAEEWKMVLQYDKEHRLSENALKRVQEVR